MGILFIPVSIRYIECKEYSYKGVVDIKQTATFQILKQMIFFDLSYLSMLVGKIKKYIYCSFYYKKYTIKIASTTSRYNTLSTSLLEQKLISQINIYAANS
ncbi:hypothetical protein HHI36_001062 [Cryptolaemus montrouzieri]|uniref:Uncharacterized protein n=1 Tax=Cryptolaemus montrouzieri TaxID=559131 RepID=A0ABD2P6K1_9CUCU